MKHTNDLAAGKVHILPGAIAGKIAAGEVIERPASVLRELLDNSIDAGATEISVTLLDGGLRSIRVTDDGCGMSRADVEICYAAHATSKIQSLTDLDHIETLGFRGEALASIAHVARLEITSRQQSGDGGRVLVENGVLREQGPPQGTAGTSVDVQQLFFNLPGRKRFLKRASTERSLCRNVFIEKALAHPDTVFRLFPDEQQPIVISGDSYRERFAAAYEEYPASVLHASEHTGDAAHISVVLADPHFHRRDRKMVQTFVNGRRVWEFGFTQAVEYGLSDMFHGGTWPVCFLFMDVDPYTVDFNIHPAKREARFIQRDRIHHDIVTALKSAAIRHGSKPVERVVSSEDRNDLFREKSTPVDSPQSYGGPRAFPRPQEEWRVRERESPDQRRELLRQTEAPAAKGDPHSNSIRYIGRVFELFIAVEYQSTLYLIDQHAAHERILYDKLRTDRSSQKLLVPHEFVVEESRQRLIAERIDEARTLGIHVEQVEGARYQITAVPQSYFGTEAFLADALTGLEVVSGEFTRELYSRIACRASIMYGDSVDPVTATELARSVFSLDEPRCPHGRPLYFAISESELRSSVGREELRRNQMPSRSPSTSTRRP